MMGGSLACSIKQAKIANKIYGFDREIKNLKYAKKNKIILQKFYSYLVMTNLIL